MEMKLSQLEAGLNKNILVCGRSDVSSTMATMIINVGTTVKWPLNSSKRHMCTSFISQNLFHYLEEFSMGILHVYIYGARC
jgi:plastocyanin